MGSGWEMGRNFPAKWLLGWPIHELRVPEAPWYVQPVDVTAAKTTQQLQVRYFVY